MKKICSLSLAVFMLLTLAFFVSCRDGGSGNSGRDRSIWTGVAAGSRHTLAIRTDGSLWAWGSNATGQLGLEGNYLLKRQPVGVGLME